MENPKQKTAFILHFAVRRVRGAGLDTVGVLFIVIAILVHHHAGSVRGVAGVEGWARDACGGRGEDYAGDGAAFVYRLDEMAGDLLDIVFVAVVADV